ncbi:uncharacterized protein TNCT_104882 [Trichonephila clavata]|uniref:Uncharacterized protein n=1 Tax=Trichonephila clavata TaxID=2740835 RepID=A0A8X6KHP0_TRICU|nr:uncharacterized protein TNCT_104882 [Trichonephila clavata]
MQNNFHTNRISCRRKPSKSFSIPKKTAKRMRVTTESEQNADVLSSYSNVQKNVAESSEDSSSSHTLTGSIITMNSKDNWTNESDTEEWLDSATKEESCSESNDTEWESFGSVEEMRSFEFSRESFSTDQLVVVPSMILDEEDSDDFCFRRTPVANSTEIELPKVFAEEPDALGTSDDFCFSRPVANSTIVKRPKVFTEEPDAFGTPDAFYFSRPVANSTVIERPRGFFEEFDAFRTPDLEERLKSSSPVEKIQFPKAETFFKDISISKSDMSLINSQKVHEKERYQSKPNSTPDLEVCDRKKSVYNQSNNTHTEVRGQYENIQNISKNIHSAKQANLPDIVEPPQFGNTSNYENQNEVSDIGRSENLVDDDSDGKYFKDLPKSSRFSQEPKYVRFMSDIRENNKKHLQHLEGIPICNLLNTEPAPSWIKLLTPVKLPGVPIERIVT